MSAAKTHPILIIAALSVIIFSATGIAAMMGWLPSSHSESASPGLEASNSAGDKPAVATQPAKQSATTKPKPVKLASSEAAAPKPAKQQPCVDCGVVESVSVIQQEGQGTGLGAVAGGVVGGLLGNQVGKGRGNTVATVAGAAGGAYAGHQVEKNMKKTNRFDITIRMDDGTTRTFQRDTDPGLASGQKVRIENGNIIPR